MSTHDDPGADLSELRWCAVVPAAGAGRRMGGGGVRKTALELGGRTILARALGCLAAVEGLAEAVLVASPRDAGLSPAALLGEDPPTGMAVHVCAGGERRQDSVLRGLKALRTSLSDAPWVLVHDGARPLCPARVVRGVLAALPTHRAAVAALPVSDTLKRVGGDGRVVETVSRKLLHRAQTPQGAERRALATALEAVLDREVTDESQALEMAGARPVLVPGDAGNIKVTVPADLVVAQALLDRPQA